MPERGTGGIAGLHYGYPAGQVPVDVVVDHEESTGTGVGLRLVPEQVQDLGRGVAGALAVAHLLDHRLGPAHRLR